MSNKTSIDIDPQDPEFRERTICRHVSGDPDCECHHDDDQDDEIGEATMDEHLEAHNAEEEGTEAPAEPEIPETLPVPLTSAQVTERELRRLEAYRGEVLADVTDKKSAKAIDEKRLEVKRARTTAARICKEQREEAIKVQKGWVAIEKGIADRLSPVEDHLEQEAERHDAWKRAEAKKAEDARREKIRLRVEEVVAEGIALEMQHVETMDNEAWDHYIATKSADQRARKRATAIAEELPALGDPCTVEEAMELEEHQAEHRLAVARKADHDRKEAARIKAEEEAEAKRKADAEAQAERERIASEERAARERLERGANRMRELALLGAVEELDILADMTETAWEVALATATQDKADRDRLASEERQRQADRDAEAAALRQQESDRLRREAEAMEQRDREAKAAAEKAEQDAKEAREAAAREEQDRQERERQEALRPEREKVAAWARAALDGMPSTPDITDAGLLNRMRQTVIAIREALLDLEEIGSTPAA